LNGLTDFLLALFLPLTTYESGRVGFQHRRGESAMFCLIRWTLAVLLLLVVTACVYFSIAAREAPRDTWWALWYIYALIGLPSLFGAILLMIPKKVPCPSKGKGWSD